MAVGERGRFEGLGAVLALLLTIVGFALAALRVEKEAPPPDPQKYSLESLPAPAVDEDAVIPAPDPIQDHLQARAARARELSEHPPRGSASF